MDSLGSNKHVLPSLASAFYSFFSRTSISSFSVCFLFFVICYCTITNL
ncbi:hypothetical protein ACNKHV_09665 [Shigella flexneri]